MATTTRADKWAPPRSKCCGAALVYFNEDTHKYEVVAWASDEQLFGEWRCCECNRAVERSATIR